MKLCECGCGKEVKTETARFLPGHHFRKKSNDAQVKKIDIQKAANIAFPEKKKNPSNAWQYILLSICFIIAGILQTILFKNFIKLPLLGFVVVYILDFIAFLICCIWVWRQRKLKEYVRFDSMETFLEEVPRWSINKSNPKSGFIGTLLNAGKEFKQIVLISKNYEPRMFWAESNGFLFIIDDRAYEMPHEVRGEAFFYDVDKKKCLNDIAPATEEDAEDSFQLASTWNIGVAVGYQEAMSKSRKEINLILLLVGVTLAAVVLSEIYNLGQIGAMNTKLDAIIKIAQDAVAQVAAGNKL